MEEIISNLIQVIAGSIITGIAWIVRTIFQLQRDLNSAHKKIRSLENAYGLSSKDGGHADRKAVD